MKFEDIINNLRAQVKELTTADNAPAVASIAKNIDDAESAYKAQTEELNDTKSTLVDYVKNTSFSKPSEDIVPEPKPEPSLDDIMMEKLNDIK